MSGAGGGDRRAAPREREEANQVRVAGQAFASALYLAAKSRSLYSPEHVHARTALDGLLAAASAVLEIGGKLSIGCDRDEVLVNGVRLRPREVGYQVIEFIVARLRGRAGALELSEDGLLAQLGALLEMVFGASAEVKASDLDRLAASGIAVVTVEENLAGEADLDRAAERGQGEGSGGGGSGGGVPGEGSTAGDGPGTGSVAGPASEAAVAGGGKILAALDKAALRSREAAGAAKETWLRALLTYLRALHVVADCHDRARKGLDLRLARVKREMQRLVDVASGGEYALLACTRIRNVPDRWTSHSVNAAVHAVYVGRAIGLDRRLLAELGLAASLADVGMALVPEHIRDKADGSKEELAVVRGHPFLSVLALLRTSMPAESLFRLVTIACYHHAEKGYPSEPPGKSTDALLQIVRVCDRFATLTSIGSGRGRLGPADACDALNANPAGYHPAIVAALKSLVGDYPVGTILRLPGGGIGMVEAPAGEPTRKVAFVRILKPGNDRTLAAGEVRELALPGAPPEIGGPRVERALDEEEALEVSDYLLLIRNHDVLARAGV